MLATEVIKKKREKRQLSSEELQFFINGYTQNEIPDYQMAALLMAILLNGMTDDETAALTQTMLESGERVQFSDIRPVDKHSTGGVGDKTSLILGPIVAACGVPVPMMSGRGLGHTGGTLDKLEAIPGFNVNLDLANFQVQVQKIGLCFIGQTPQICPADKKIYALRDVTGTVESLPLICASIMSKKIAEGIKGLVLDVKFGSGAFMKSLSDAQQLADGLISIGKSHGLECKALLTNMEQPLGRFVGNALEVGECLSILKQERFLGNSHDQFLDTTALSLALSSEMIAVGKGISLQEAETMAQDALSSGRAYEVLQKTCSAQGGQLQDLAWATQTTEILATESGYLSDFNCEAIGIAGIELGAGRRKVTDRIDPGTGIEVLKKIGEEVTVGEPLFRVFHNDGQTIDQALQLLSGCFQLSSKTVTPPALIIEKRA